MKENVNLNDLRRLRLLIAAGATVPQVSARLHIQPSVVAKWFEKLAAPEAPPMSPPAGDPGLEVPRARGRRKIT